LLVLSADATAASSLVQIELTKRQTLQCLVSDQQTSLNVILSYLWTF
jgi:hypothetical protein